MRLSFIGTAGVPNRYGGFEAFLEACAPRIAALGHDVRVTCDAARYVDRARDWRGVQRIFVRVPANGLLSVVHDLAAFLAVFWRSDAVLVMGVSGGIWFPWMALLAWLARARLVVNVDGVEWRRGRSRLRNAFLYLSDRVAQRFASAIIYDNEALLPFVLPSRRQRARFIPYPGDHVTRLDPAPPARAGGSCLSICRIEPENNCELLLEAARRAGVEQYVFVGNWNGSEYGRRLREMYGKTPGFRLLDPVYDAGALARLREECSVYLHGHSVGGTNPSLVEMLFYDCAIAAYDCRFNRLTAGEAAVYFSSADGLAELLRHGLPQGERGRVRGVYTCDRVARQYAAVAAGDPDPAG